MFTDTEVALSMRYNAEVTQVTRQAQSIVDRQDREIAKLRRALSAALTDNEILRREKGQRAIADMEAFRAARKRAAN